jgi:hypothetical protein
LRGVHEPGMPLNGLVRAPQRTARRAEGPAPVEALGVRAFVPFVSSVVKTWVSPVTA